MVTVLAGVTLTFLGLAVGSFLNVVIYRVPRGESIASPASACPQCGHAVRWKDNIPVISWFCLRGRCRDCQWPIPRRYVLVEVANVAVWWLLTVWAVSNDSLGLLPWLLVLSSASVALTLIDLEHFRLPNSIVYPLYPVLLVGLVVSAFVDGEVPWTSALIGAGAWFAVIGGIWLVTRGRGMGLGDVKLAPVLGATLGWVSVGSALVGLFAAFAVGALVGVALILGGRAGRKTAVPFGPFLIAGALLGLIVGNVIVDSYLALIGSLL
jgi:leader peptidase (prepilin peptidase) / N-methyltransferase